MSIRIDKNIIGPDIPSLLPLHMVIVSGRQYCVNQVPQLILLKKLITDPFSVMNLVTEQVWVVVVCDYSNTTVPAKPFALVGLLNGLHQAVVFWDFFDSGLPLVELRLVC